MEKQLTCPLCKGSFPVFGRRGGNNRSHSRRVVLILRILVEFYAEHYEQDYDHDAEQEYDNSGPDLGIVSVSSADPEERLYASDEAAALLFLDLIIRIERLIFAALVMYEQAALIGAAGTGRP